MRSTRHPALPLATFSLALALVGPSCGGGAKPAASAGGPAARPGAGAGEVGEGTATTAGARLVELVSKIAEQTTHADDCNQFARLLEAWTERNQAEVEQLVSEIQSAPTIGDAGEVERMDAEIVEAYLAVVEAAAECGDNEDAMRAYESFNTAVEKATY